MEFLFFITIALAIFIPIFMVLSKFFIEDDDARMIILVFLTVGGGFGIFMMFLFSLDPGGSADTGSASVVSVPCTGEEMMLTVVVRQPTQFNIILEGTNMGSFYTDDRLELCNYPDDHCGLLGFSAGDEIKFEYPGGPTRIIVECHEHMVVELSEPEPVELPPEQPPTVPTVSTGEVFDIDLDLEDV